MASAPVCPARALPPSSNRTQLAILPSRSYASLWLGVTIAIALLLVTSGCGGGGNGGNGTSAPSFTSQSQATFTVGSQGNFTITATGNPTPTIQLTGNLPSGVSFVGGNGLATLSGMPANGTAGQYGLTLTASNGVAPNAMQNFSLTVDNQVGPGVSQLVQHVSCPNSRNTGNPQSATPDYTCPLPEPSQAGNALIVGVESSNSGTFTLSDDKSNTWTLADSVVDGNGQYVAIYVATNVAAGTRSITLHRSADTENVAMSASEYYNVALSSAIDVHGCKAAGGNSTTISVGSITPADSGDLLWQWAVNTGGGGGLPNSVASIAAGSQPNITWQLNGTDLYDGDAVQAGIYNSTSAISATFSSGSAEQFTSCVVALKGASAGNAPTRAFRIVHALHQQAPSSGQNPWPMEFPTSGNLLVLSDIAGGASISGIMSVPANTWTSTGVAAGGQGITALAQIYYAANASAGNTLTLAVTRSVPLTEDTFMMYDFAGAAASPFDTDSGGQIGSQASIATSFTTCSNCLTPSGNGGSLEVIIGNGGWNFCTATGSTSPSGALFDAATDTGNGVDGPQSVDQNNGWFHSYVTTTTAISATWKMTCGTTPEGAWAGRAAAFKAAQ